MPLKKTAANIIVDADGEEIVQVLYTLISLVRRGGVLAPSYKQSGEPLQRILIHGIHEAHISHNEVQQRSALSDGSIKL